MSIYNTGRSGRAAPRRGGAVGGGPPRPGATALTPQQQQLRQLQLQQRQQQQQQQQQLEQEENTYNEFQLMSTSRRGQSHLMEFKSNKKVEPSQFARPAKLHRRDNGFLPFRQYIQNLNEQKSAEAAVQAAKAAQAQAIMAGTEIPPSDVMKKGSNVEDLNGSSSHGPKTGADTSLIAPLGGATRNKQMLFKKRTRQIFLAKEDTRELKEQEHQPWILEDYDGHNSFTGTYEGGLRSDYMFFVLTDNGFKVMPVDRWYKFQPKRNFKTLSLEEAEEALKKQQKHENGRWMMLKRGEQANVEEGTSRPKLKVVDHDENKDDESKNKQDSDMDDIDFDDVFQDDEEMTAEHEVEDEEVKDGKDRVKKEIKDFAIGGQDFDDDDDAAKLTSEGKQMRKLVRDLEKNRNYESDEEADPYASSAEELDSDGDLDMEDDDKEKDKKSAIPPKKKAVVPFPKPMMPKKAHTAKIKKEGMSKPIGRPGSPSLYIKKEARSASPPTTGARPSSPSSPLRSQQRTSPVPSSPPKEQSKKRKLEEGSGTSESKHRKTHKDSELITEQEVIDTLRGKAMTTKEFLLSFRKRIKTNPQNRDVITNLLKKLAKRSNSEDPSTRLLELKPEYH